MTDKIQLPQSGGGLIRYTEEEKSKIMMSPKTVVVLIAIVIVFSLILHTRLFGLLG